MRLPIPGDSRSVAAYLEANRARHTPRYSTKPGEGLPHAAVEHAVWDAYRPVLIEGGAAVTAWALTEAIKRTRSRPW